MIAISVTVLAALQAAVPAPPATMQTAAASLVGKSQCVAFNWIADAKGSPKAAIGVPVIINGQPKLLQFDTGSDVSMIYGASAARAGWSQPGDKTFRATTFSIGSTQIDRPTIHVNAAMKDDGRLVGTLGLPALMGHVAVIDYPHARFCLFAEADVPAAIADVPYVRADLRYTKMFVPVSVGDYRSDALVFDTGSSELPLNVDFASWKRLTGRAATANSPATFTGMAWGKPIAFAGAPASQPMMLGKANLGTPLVYTNTAEPAAFAGWPMRTDGVIGNASLWGGIVILDLTARVRFGYVH